MYVQTKVDRFVTLVAAVIAIAAFAACDASPTDPSRVRSPGVSHRDIQGDTLGCKGGWSIVNGWYVCN